jgi:hypothetical protein
MSAARIAAIVLGCSWTVGAVWNAAAQTESKSAVTIRVMDATGAVIPGAAIHAANVDTGAVQSISTGPTGSASLSPPSGTYTASISARGFETFVGHFTVPVETGGPFEVMLRVGSSGPMVDVELPMPEEHSDLIASIPLIPLETLTALPAKRLRHRNPRSL